MIFELHLLCYEIVTLPGPMGNIRDHRTMKTYKLHVQVLSSHVDSAGIVQFSKYLEMAHGVIEQWFDEALDHAFAQFQGVDNAIVPVGRANMTFPAASRLGDVLVWRLQVNEMGRSSINFALTASCGGEIRADMSIEMVHSDMDVLRARRWPDALRARAEEYRKSEEPA